ncbi:penicillin acylase family protein, partial [Parapedobacter sp. SGR-10]|uniref:penicillin acylase family protein n=1 Tax=Parapedobacter sp. SGR-10 TaxID=2710879 RepID=UPI0013CFA3D4
KQYLYKGKWEDMDVLTDTVHIKDKESITVDLAYTRHGPVVYVDSLHNKAYAVRCGWLEVGGAPYLASLRMGQTKTWEEFREACSYSNIPGENMIWADREGNIGWQAVGITPIRPNFSGLVPVPGDGRYEWAGYLPIKERPHAFNPLNGFIATANQNIIPQDYVHMNAVGYSWADPFRGDRINEVLRGGTKFTMDDMRELQVDYLSIPARQLIPLLMKLPFDGKSAEAKNRLANWDYRLLSSSIEAAIYVALENEIKRLSVELFVPTSAKEIIKSIQLGKIISWLLNPDSRFGTNPDQGRDDFLIKAFDNAVANLEQKLGEDMNHWQYGQEKFKHTYLEHPLSKLVNSNTRDKLDLGPLPRGGNGYTVGATGNNDKQNHGALFKIIVNTGDWDATIATSGPGQSGNPESPFYSNLFDSWAKDDYFPVYYSRNKIESVAASKEILAPTERL